MIDYPQEMIRLLKNSKRVLMTSHVYPDGDAVGSMVGLARSLRKNGAAVDLALSTNIGERFLFLVEKEKVLTPEAVQTGYDLVVILDIGDEVRTGFHEVIRGLNCPIINIDHHATNAGFADFDIMDYDATSTCEMVCHLIRRVKLPLDKEVAEALYLGMLTDSRYFQNSNVRPETFLAAAELLKTGLDPQPIIKRLTQSRSLLDLKVLGLALRTMGTRAGGKVIYTIIHRDDLKALGATHRHAWSAGVFSYLISMEHAIVSASFVEAENAVTYCEFRSKDGFDVSGIALDYGGGGHKAASGCSVERPADDLATEVLQRLEEMIRAHGSAGETPQ